ncbi:MAG TPA: signal peptide peptidase SppA [Myxococcales bacterium]|nr:signal peptide peptidase SppA [Myxococcales bacterium]
MSVRRKYRFCLLFVLGLLVAMFWFGEEPGPVIDADSTLVLEIGGAYAEASQAPWISRLLGEGSPPFSGLLSLFDLAERDSRLGTVVLVIRPLDIGWGKVGELREAIGRLEAAGHRTLAYLEMATFSGSREYFLASAADEVWVVPAGSVPVLGLAAEYFFLGGLWDNLGIEFDVAKAGRYKSAVEVYTATGMSEPSREMANSLLDSTNDFFLSGIAQGRGMSVEEVRAAIDHGPILPVDLESLGLIDGVEHLDVLLDALGEAVVEHDEYAAVSPEEVGFAPVARAALIYGSGPVVSGWGARSPGGESVFAAGRVAESLERAAEDPSIDAIILRIDSPGGSALAAEEIWRSIGTAQQAGKPIIASFSDVAASGGYYVAVAADEIVSNDATLTGSIGVFALRPVLAGGLAKLGVSSESLTRGRHADFMLSNPPLSPSGRKRLQAMVLQIYDLFVSRVAEGRGMERDAVDRVGQGRVWTGSQAYELGLVDFLGGLHTATDRVRRRLNLAADADVALVPFPPPRSLSEELTDALDVRLAQMVEARLPLPEALRSVQSWLADLPMGSPLLVPPYLIEIR